MRWVPNSHLQILVPRNDLHFVRCHEEQKNIRAPREDSGKPWHPPSRIIVLIVHMKDNSNLTVLMSWLVWSYPFVVLPCLNLLFLLLLFYFVVVFLFVLFVLFVVVFFFFLFCFFGGGGCYCCF